MATKINDFFKDNSIKIPIIQRDYVQGSNLWAVKRDEFICSLFDALINKNTLLLDFVYGVKDNEEFIPLDGQQRLTTLSLLGWLLANLDRFATDKESEKEDVYNKRIRTLGIKYRVRESSRIFCDNLFMSKLKDVTKAPSEEIKNSLWFAESWNSDPSIVSMLQILDKMWAILQTKDYKNAIGSMGKNFFENAPIEFEETILPNQKKPDDLYIKINARGKHLTEFEHWKVKFIQILSRFPAVLYPNSKKSLREYFEEKIETDWCNLFWDFAIENWKEKTEGYPLIDTFLMNFIKNVTYVFYSVYWGEDLKNIPNPDKVYKTIYRHHIFAIILFEWLDALVWIVKSWTPNSATYDESLSDSMKIEAFFSEILFTEININNISWLKENKVNIFNENAGKINLFKSAALNEQLEIRPLLLLLGILSYVAKNKSSVNILEFTRQWWILIMTLHRQRLKDGFAVRTDIRLKEHGKEFYKWLLRLLGIKNGRIQGRNLTGTSNTSTLLPSPHKFANYHYPTQIVPLYNCPWLLADIHILQTVLSTGVTSTPATDFYNKIVMPNNVDRNVDRIKMLIENGYEGTHVNSSNYTFGIVEKIWPYIFSDSDSNHRLSNALCNILSGNQQTVSSKDWLAEFVYENIDILNRAKQEFAAFMKVKEYELFSIPEGRSFTKQGFRLEPYAFVVAEKAGAFVNTENRNAVYRNSHGSEIHIDLYSENSTRYGISFPKYKLHFESVIAGWKLAFYSNDGDDLPASFVQRFGSGPFKDNDNKYIINIDIFKDDPQKNHVDNGIEIFKTLSDLLL